MAIEKNSSVLRYIRAIFSEGVAAELTDRQLLERFTNRPGRDDSAELAFAALVERHGPMVLRVCRAALRDEHDAQDAFQAVFLVLVHKARLLRVRDSLGPWLHAVALRVSTHARVLAMKRQRPRAQERRDVDAIRGRYGRSPPTSWDVAIHEEVGRLPEAFRKAVVLCDLEGLTHEEAARRLGWPVGTVKSRQARGRERLRGRLIRRGLAPVSGRRGRRAVDESGAGGGLRVSAHIHGQDGGAGRSRQRRGRHDLRADAHRDSRSPPSHVADPIADRGGRHPVPRYGRHGGRPGDSFRRCRGAVASPGGRSRRYGLVPRRKRRGRRSMRCGPRISRPRSGSTACPKNVVAVLGEVRGRHAGEVRGLALSRDGKLLVTIADQDKKVRLWDAQTLLPLGSLAGHRAFVNCVALSPDGHWLASGGAYGDFFLWDMSLTPPKGPTLLPTHGTVNKFNNCIHATAFSPDGRDARRGRRCRRASSSSTCPAPSRPRAACCRASTSRSIR